MEKKSVSIDSIIEPSDEMRSFVSAEGLQELADSISKCGLINPLTVAAFGSDKYIIIAGVRRFLACKLAGKQVVDVNVASLSGLDSEMLKIHENLYREDVNPVDEGRFYFNLQTKFSLSVQDLSRLTKKSDSYVYSRLSILSSDEKMLSALEAKHISLSIAEELNKISDQQTRHYYLSMAIEQGITLSTARSWRINWEIQSGHRQEPEQPSAAQLQQAGSILYHDSCFCCSVDVPMHQRQIIIVCPTCAKLIKNPPK